MRVVVVGSLNWDLTLQVDRLPSSGETVLGRGLTQGPGGKGLNQAIAAARAGAPTAIVGCVGTDDAGDRLLAVLAEEKIDTSAVRRDAQSATGMAWITLGGDGDGTIVVASLANAALVADEVGAACAQELATDERAVVLVQAEVPPAVIEAALHAARAGRAVTVFNPAPAAPLPDAWLPLIDYLIPNEHELPVVVGRDGDDDSHGGDARVIVDGVARLVAGGCGAVIVTRGARGALVVDRTGVEEVHAFSVDRVVDSTGAGDAFCGTFAAGLAVGLDRAVALRRAAAAGALAVGRPGAASSLPTGAEIDALTGR